MSQETRNMKRKPNVSIVVKHDSFGGHLIYCAERYAKVKVEGEADGNFDQKVPDLPLFTNAPNFSPDLLDMGGSGSRSEDIALARSQGLDVDDDNEPTPENVLAEGLVIDTTSNLHGQTWGWGGTCHQKTAHHTNDSPGIKDYTKSGPKFVSKLDMFLLFFSLDYLENVIVLETSEMLVLQALPWLYIFYVMLQWSGSNRLLLFCFNIIRGRCTISIESVHAWLPIYTDY